MEVEKPEEYDGVNHSKRNAGLGFNIDIHSQCKMARVLVTLAV
jgi:hypothetical protein